MKTMKKSYKDYFSEFSYDNQKIMAYRNKRRFVMALKVLVLVGLILWLSFAELSKYMSELIAIPLILILPSLIFKPWQVFQRQYVGRITSISIEDRRVDFNKVRRYSGVRSGVYARLINVTYMFCSVEGQKRNYVFRVERTYERAYQVGDFVMNVSGLVLPINLTPHDIKTCPCCGSIYPRENDRCVDGACQMPAVFIKHPIPQLTLSEEETK